jgi:hypothetical protein
MRLRQSHLSSQKNWLAALAGIWLIAYGLMLPAGAQSVCLPLPRLLTTMPMGGQAGQQVEVVISGENLEDVELLLFNHPGLVATSKLDESGKPISNNFVVAIAPDCPPGLYEARVLSRLGVSSSRIFSVGELPELVQQGDITKLDAARELPVNSICNSVATAKGVDHYWFTADAGQRYVINCLARGIDSKMDPVIVVADATGRDLVVNRQGDTIDFVASESGRYVVKVHELTFRGGPAFFYRLVLQTLAADAQLPQFPTTQTVSSFSWPPQGLAVDASTSEIEPNHATESAQRISLPCDIRGQFFPAADVDCYEFEAHQGETWWIEVASERLGRPTDPQVLVQRVQRDGESETLHDVIELSDIPSPMKPSSNGYAYDGPPYDGGSLDVLGKLEIKEDGLYRLSVTDLFGGTRSDARNRYRLVVRKAAPDFALAAWGLHMELRNGDRNALSKPLALRAGTTVALEVVAVRRDGFDGEIELRMENLPPGVTTAGLKIPSGKSRGIMLVTADPQAPRGFMEASFVGRGVIEGETVERPVRMAQMAWPIVDSWSEIPSPRLVAGIPVSVTESEVAPLTITPQEAKDVWEVTTGQKLTIPLVLQRRSEFSGSVLQLKTLGEGFENNPRFDVSLTADAAEATLDLAALKTPPGEYLVTFYGAAVAQYSYNPGAVLVAQRLAAEQQQQVDSLKQTLASLRQQLAEASETEKANTSEQVAATEKELAAAEQLLTQRNEHVKTLTNQSAPRDTVDIVLSTPIAIRVTQGEAQ